MTPVAGETPESASAPAESASESVPNLQSSASAGRRVKDVLFRIFLFASLGIALGTLATLLLDTFLEGRPRLNIDLVRNFPSARPARAGIQSAIFGSIWVVGTTAVISLPLGIAAAVYLEEFARKDRWYNRLIELNIQNLAAVPSVVYGILGLAFIARGPLDLGFTVLTAALILTMVVLPTVVIASREAIRAVPKSLRDGGLALGATRWQTVSRQVLPSAVPGIATGSILATSRALGESAPLLLTGALTFVTFNPDGFDSAYTVLPIQIFRYISEAKDEFKPLAAASAIVLLIFLVTMNSVAIFVRNKFQRKW
ncbi:MAG: phosphate ABC transporter permease PstA [Ilumatobacteraceae bacterium]